MFQKRAANDTRPTLDPGPAWQPRLECDDDGYPVSDGLPMAESTYQGRQIRYVIAALEAFYTNRDDVFVAGDLFLHYRRGDRSASVVPDVLVSFGGEGHGRDRMSYKLWEDPVPPFIMEVLSHRTWKNDVEDKRDKYAAMGVEEFWLFDPYNKYLDGRRLASYRLRDGAYVPLRFPPDGVVSSEVLGLEFRDADGELRMRDPATGEDFPTIRERQDAHLKERNAHFKERDAHQATKAHLRAAEERIAELERALRQSSSRPNG